MIRKRLFPLGRIAVCLPLFVATVVAISCDRGASIDQSDASASSAMVQQSSATTSDEATAEKPSRVMVSALAGNWYPANRDVLGREIDKYVAKVTGEQLEDVCALVLPHAGYRWSGTTAAYGLYQIRQRSFQRVIVVGPSHRVAMKNVASVPNYTHYETPLGRVPLDQAFLARLRTHEVFQNIPAAHEREHSVQIELPMLQRVLGRFQLVPIVVGELDEKTIRGMARILSDMVDRETLVVASSDFTHYGASFGYLPFTDNIPAKIKELDDGALRQLRQKDLDGWLEYIATTKATICGRYSIGVLLAMLPGDAKVHQLQYEMSATATGDFSSSVSYCALAVTGKWPQAKQPVENSWLPATDRERLLQLARATLAHVLHAQETPSAEQLGIEITPAMKRVCGAFVTLKKHGALRGCIGEILPRRPLYQCVMQQAVNAGLHDPRFPKVRLSELETIEFEISVLTPPRKVKSRKEIEIGKHGIILTKDGRAAVFLPQVAPEQGWDLETTLTHLAQKAGLPRDAWRNGASFEVFEAIVFGEKQDNEAASLGTDTRSGVLCPSCPNIAVSRFFDRVRG